jgi:hypothetical protein
METSHTACCQLQNCILAFHSEQASLICLLIYQYCTAHVNTALLRQQYDAME